MTGEPTPLPSGAVASGTVLVVDDQDELRDLLRRALDRPERTVLEAAGVDDALAVLARGPVDLIVSDVELGLGTAEDLLHALRLAAPGVPVILISGFVDIAESVRAGVFAFLAKPFTFAELAAVVEQALGG